METGVAATSQSSVSLVTDNMADCERLMMQGQAQFMLCHHHAAAQTSLDSTYFRSLDVGWDTLAVRVFEMTSNGEWERAALPAVAIVIVGLIPAALLTRRGTYVA